MSQLVLDIPDEHLLSLKLSQDPFARDLRTAAAARLYELQRLSQALLAFPTQCRNPGAPSNFAGEPAQA